MNDIRRTILWVIFGFSMVLLWDQWQVYTGHKATFFPSPAKVTVPAANVPAAAAATSVPPSTPAGTSTASASVPAGVPTLSVANAAVRERIVAATDVLRMTFDTEGGSVVRTEFVKHIDMADKTQNFVLLDESKDRTYLAQTGLIAGASGGSFPTHKVVMTLMPGERTLKEGGNQLTISFESPEQGGVKLVKTYTLVRGSYAVAVRHDVVNKSAAAVSPQLYLQLVRDGNKPPGESSFYSTFTGPAVYTDAKKYQKV